MTIVLDAAHAWIFRITHIDNLAWDLENGLQCRNSHILNPRFRNIGNKDLIEKRRSRAVDARTGGTLSDYVPFYFTSHSPMLYNIRTGYNGLAKVSMEEIVIYVASLRDVASSGIAYAFTDMHAKLAMARFYVDAADLNHIDWDILQKRDFRYDPSDPEKMDRYQAEALIRHQLPCRALKGIVCYGAQQVARAKQLAKRAGIQVPVGARPQLYFP